MRGRFSFTYGSGKDEKLEVSNRTLVDYPAVVDSIVAQIPVKFSAKEPTNGLIVMPEKSTYNWDKSLTYNIIPGFSKYHQGDTAYIYQDIIEFIFNRQLFLSFITV